jgi:hypothetical protein
VSTDAGSAFDADASLVFGAISRAVRGSKRKRFGPFFSNQFACGGRSFGLHEHGAGALPIFKVTRSPE